MDEQEGWAAVSKRDVALMVGARLRALGACDDAVAWVAAQPDWKTAWTECQHGDWMMWFLVNRDVRAAGEPVDTDARLRRIALRAADRAVREHAPAEIERAAAHAAEPLASALRAHAAALRALPVIDTVKRARAAARATDATDATAAADAASYAAYAASYSAVAAAAIAASADRAREHARSADDVRHEFPAPPAWCSVATPGVRP